MIKPEQVPYEAFNAAARVEDKNDINAIIAAALNAWPGMELDEAMWSGGTNFIVLPLTQENSDEPK